MLHQFTGVGFFRRMRRHRKRINRRSKAKISSTIPSTAHVIPFQPAKSCPGVKLWDTCFQPLAGPA